MKGRIAALDAVRGIAALTVVMSHAIRLVSDDPRTDFAAWSGIVVPGTPFVRGIPLGWPQTPLGLLENARPAVLLFFVLSGYVLTLGWRPGAGYGRWALRRFVRIYPPFAAAVLVAAGLSVVLAGPLPGGFSPWAATTWSDGAGPRVLGLHLSMAGVSDAGQSLDPPVWSLVYEMRMSLLLPVLAWVAGLPVLAALAIGAVVQGGADWGLAALGAPGRPYMAGSGVESVVMTLHFVLPFLLGAMLARHRVTVGRVLARLPGWAWGAGFGVGILLLMRWGDVPGTLGAAVLVMLVAHSGAAARVLGGPALGWLGRVSYSLYLIHLPVLMALIHLVGGRLAPGWVMAAGIPACLVAAEGLWRLVERPSIAASRLVGRTRAQVAAA